MPRFLRKSSTKESNKGKNSEKKKNKKGKDKASSNLPTQGFYDEEEEENNTNGSIGVQRCRRLLASCPKRSGSAKCVATFRRNSRLSKSLLEVLMDDSVLPYFMEFMQKQNAVNLLNFWLTSETFRLSTISRLRMNSLLRMKSSSSGETLVNGNSETDAPNHQKSPSSSSKNERLLSDSSSDSEFGCFSGYSDPSEITGPKQMLDKLNTGAILICDKCGNIIDRTLDKCTMCVSEMPDSDVDGKLTVADSSQNSKNAGLVTENISSSSHNKRDGLSEKIFNPGRLDFDEVFNYSDDASRNTNNKSETRKVTFDLKPDFENEEREFCRRRTRSIVIDAMSVYSKYISLEATHPFGLDEPLRRQVEANICSEDGKIDPECFSPGQKFAFNVMERMYFPTFIQSTFYFKHQLDILTSNKVFLSDIIYNQHAMFYFMEFLEQEDVRHMLEFWLTADNFQSLLQDKLKSGEYNTQQALDDAMIIYERYFSMQASLPLGFDDVTRIEVENSICREGGPLPECFGIPLEHILCLLEEVFFPSFLQSDIYYKYLNELLNSVTDSPNPSETSDHYESHPTKHGGHTDESTRLVNSFGSDLDLTENPDAIWHRPNAGPLSLGRVNEFGIFEPIFEPEPDQERNNTSTAAKLGKAMRKLVSGGEDKAKEEMAWKIAKMMIEDVKTEQTRISASRN
ncbi:A-kinase anchor protein 10, mitochondrial-like [Actinia tenebrosa]|uniref:A-kinase anchor protein 10, mitochondrial-like n=1 Tax=Actinia tenebrosa TaxID=6105 RepID=A0A6P8HAA3_ACTTE|nr:A-kinase anchor protein 10, mitochondrial-like [Actinia tenebrosa]